MIDLEEKLLTHFTPLQWVIAGVLIGLIGVLPLGLYIVFGPSDGNPIGLGLLAIVAIPFSIMITAVGLIRFTIAFILSLKRK